MTSYQVAEGTQVHHAGRTHAAGETVKVDAALAAEWVARGYLIEAKPKAKRGKR